MGLVCIISSIYGVLILAFLVGLVYVVYNRVKESEKEDFEQRNN